MLEWFWQEKGLVRLPKHSMLPTALLPGGLRSTTVAKHGRKNQGLVAQKFMNRIYKIVVAKSLTENRQSTRKLAARLTAAGHPVSMSTLQRYMVKYLGCRPFLQPKYQKLVKTEARLI